MSARAPCVCVFFVWADLWTCCSFIVLELAKGGELFEQIAERGRHSEVEARHYFVQMLEAVQYLHAHSICHRGRL